MRTFNLAAIAALIMFPVVAFAGGESSGNGDEIEDPAQDPGRAAAELNERYGRRPAPAPVAPATPAPLPDTGGGEVVNPPPTAPPFVFDPNLPPIEAPRLSDGFVRVGISGAVLGYFAPMTAEVIDENSYPLLSGADGLVSGYVGTTLGEHDHAYLEINFSYGRGTIDSQYLGAGAMIGAQIAEELILGGVVMGGVRDSDLEGLAYTSRRVGALVGPKLLWELDKNENSFDARLGAAGLLGYSMNRHAITQQVLAGPEFGALVEIQIGGQTH